MGCEWTAAIVSKLLIDDTGSVLLARKSITPSYKGMRKLRLSLHFDFGNKKGLTLRLSQSSFSP